MCGFGGEAIEPGRGGRGPPPPPPPTLCGKAESISRRTRTISLPACAKNLRSSRSKKPLVDPRRIMGGAGGKRAISSCPVGGAGYFPRVANARSGSSGMSTSNGSAESDREAHEE